MNKLLTPGPIQELWLQSLKNNPERQSRSCLGHYIMGKEKKEYRACCLGELALITGKAKFIDNDLKVILPDGKQGSSHTLIGIHEELGLNSPAGACNGIDHNSLATNNDIYMTWPEIAIHVRKNFNLYFNKSY